MPVRPTIGAVYLFAGAFLVLSVFVGTPQVYAAYSLQASPNLPSFLGASGSANIFGKECQDKVSKTEANCAKEAQSKTGCTLHKVDSTYLIGNLFIKINYNINLY